MSRALVGLPDQPTMGITRAVGSSRAVIGSQHPHQPHQPLKPSRQPTTAISAGHGWLVTRPTNLVMALSWLVRNQQARRTRQRTDALPGHCCLDRVQYSPSTLRACSAAPEVPVGRSPTAPQTPTQVLMATSRQHTQSCRVRHPPSIHFASGPRGFPPAGASQAVGWSQDQPIFISARADGWSA